MSDLSEVDVDVTERSSPGIALAMTIVRTYTATDAWQHHQLGTND